MRHSVSKTIALGLLSTYILHSSGNPIVPIAPCQGEVECRDPLRTTNWPHLARTKAPSPAFDRRASGGGRPTKPDEHSPNAPQANPNDPNSPSSPGDQQGESGGFSEEQETSGGFSNSEETEGGINNNGDDTADPGSNAQPAAPDPNAQPANPNPAPNAPAANNPGQPNAVQYPPSARNNHNQPATSANDPFNPQASTVAVIHVATRANEFRGTITQKGLAGRPWCFYSGLNRGDIDDFREALGRKIGEANMPAMGSVLPIDVGQRYYTDYTIYKGDVPSEKYFWAANSKAYAQAVEGKIYAVIEAGRSVNQPYPDKGSNWWTFEVPELTRNTRVDSITVISMKKDTSVVQYIDPPEAFYMGAERVIWRRGDEPIGFPADELHQLERPGEPWETLPDVLIPR
jgi:hypothetical protein